MVPTVPRDWSRGGGVVMGNYLRNPREFDGWLKANAILSSMFAIGILAMTLAGLNSEGRPDGATEPSTDIPRMTPKPAALDRGVLRGGHQPKATKSLGAAGYSTTSTLTFATPLPVMPSVSAADADTSTTRPRTNGPRSLTRTVTERPVSTSVTRNRVPNGSVRWAAVNSFLLNFSPLAVCGS